MSQSNVKAALLKTIDGIKSNPQFSNVVFRADTEWLDDVRCSAKIRDFAPMTIDEPPELGGQDSAPNPVELVLAALGSCQEIMYSAYAAVMGITLESVSVKVRGYLDLHGLLGLDASVPPGYQRIVFHTDIASDTSDEELQKLIDTVESRCPVLDILQRPQQVSGSVHVAGRQLHASQHNAA